MLSILLPPFDEKVSVPPFEHIPYLFTRIEVLPDGLVKFDETIMVVANNQKLRYPLAKALPTYMVDRNGNGHKIEASLIGVTINDQPVAYKISERGGDTLIMPETVFPLESGVYKYVFSYVIDRQIARYDNFDELRWDVSGGNWNLDYQPSRAASVTRRPTPKPWGSRFWLAIRSIILPKKRLLPGSPKTSWDLRLKNRCSLPRECRLRLLFPKALSANRFCKIAELADCRLWRNHLPGAGLPGYSGFLSGIVEIYSAKQQKTTGQTGQDSADAALSADRKIR